MEHVSVLKNDVQKYLSLKDAEKVVDATLGLGGHSLDILEKVGKSGHLYAFEQDERNLEEAKKRLKDFDSQITYFHDNFRYLKTRITGVDAILFDLGLSSPHIEDAARGFSFQNEGPLDMRFDPRAKLTAEIVLNTYAEDDLANIFFKYGEERMGRKVARKICEEREERPFKTTVQLREFLETFMFQKRGKKAHPATKIFQALRIEVNEELKVLEEVLEQAAEILNIGGRVVVISYHSLEDRIVKQFFKKLIQPPITDPQEALYRNHGDPIFEALTKKPVVPTDEEIELNPRSRSAKLRAYKKLKSLS